MLLLSSLNNLIYYAYIIFQRCWWFWDGAQNMLIFGEECSTPLSVLKHTFAIYTISFISFHMFSDVVCSGDGGVLTLTFVPGMGEFSHWHDICMCVCLLGCFFRKFWYNSEGGSSLIKAPNLHNGCVLSKLHLIYILVVF